MSAPGKVGMPPAQPDFLSGKKKPQETLSGLRGFFRSMAGKLQACGVAELPGADNTKERNGGG